MHIYAKFVLGANYISTQHYYLYEGNLNINTCEKLYIRYDYLYDNYYYCIMVPLVFIQNQLF